MGLQPTKLVENTIRLIARNRMNTFFAASRNFGRAQSLLGNRSG